MFCLHLECIIAARIILLKHVSGHITLALPILPWLPVAFRIEVRVSSLAWKACHDLSPRCVSSLPSARILWTLTFTPLPHPPGPWFRAYSPTLLSHLFSFSYTPVFPCRGLPSHPPPTQQTSWWPFRISSAAISYKKHLRDSSWFSDTPPPPPNPEWLLFSPYSSILAHVILC